MSKYKRKSINISKEQRKRNNVSYTAIYDDCLNKNISNGAFKLNYLIQSKCYKGTEMFYSQETLANEMGVCVRTIQRYLKELVDAKLISIKRRGKKLTNIYTVLRKVMVEKQNNLNEKINELKEKHSKKKSSGKSFNKDNKKLQFTNYSQREYDYDKLEKQLLGWE
ncbi:helix-turn-helix domain-containing protein [Clostridium tarantellae]|uniref:helix-turn-helix domain-containing protein n=1 Tax=Clostridium tarantellae TaxID=39493 RepID=UPI0014788324|nr:helix-turn-helix domain-containing protein [Clostridium tarantellae]